jgi:hypothetical protein
MSKTATVVTDDPEETSNAAEETVQGSVITHEVIAPDGTMSTVEGDRQTVIAWMEERRLAKGQKYLVNTSRVWNYRPKGPRVKLTPEEKAARKTQRAQEREAKKAETKAKREAKKAEVAQRKKERAEKAAARKAEKERIKAEKAAGTYKVVATKGGAKIAVKQPAASTAQLAALTRARQKAADVKARGSNGKR